MVIHKMKTNEDLQKEVQEAFKFEPLLDATSINITVEDGIVTLSGMVDNYAKKSRAEEAAKYVVGVVAVVENIVVKFETITFRTDHEIAKEVINAFKSHWDVPHDNLTIKVEDGWVSLEGEIEWNYQKEAAKNAVTTLQGVKGVSNNIMVVPKTKSGINITDIEDALWRHVVIDQNNIIVTASGSKVTLTGSVESWHQKEEASRVVWRAKGVLEIDNQLVIKDHS